MKKEVKFDKVEMEEIKKEVLKEPEPEEEEDKNIGVNEMTAEEWTVFGSICDKVSLECSDTARLKKAIEEGKIKVTTDAELKLELLNRYSEMIENIENGKYR